MLDAAQSLPPSDDPSCGVTSSLAVSYKTFNDSKFKSEETTEEKLL